MPGPVPKPKSERRNRNPKESGDWILLPAGGRAGPIPDAEGLPKSQKKWWNQVWRSPMATQWEEDDIPALIELAYLRDQFFDGSDKVASELRRRTMDFGLNPAGRQARRWMITEKDQERAGVHESEITKVSHLRVAVDRE